MLEGNGELAPWLLLFSAQVPTSGQPVSEAFELPRLLGAQRRQLLSLLGLPDTRSPLASIVTASVSGAVSIGRLASRRGAPAFGLASWSSWRSSGLDGCDLGCEVVAVVIFVLVSARQRTRDEPAGALARRRSSARLAARLRGGGSRA